MIIYDDTENNDFDHFNDVIEDINSLWNLNSTTGTVDIPYVIDSMIDERFRREKIQKAVEEFNYKTCIR